MYFPNVRGDLHLLRVSTNIVWETEMKELN